MRWWRAAGAAAVSAAAVVWACGGAGSGDVAPGRDAGPPPVNTDAGLPDAGPPDAGPPDAGPPDAGPPDAGPPDGGFVPPPAIPFPTVPNWTFLGPQHGGPHDVFQVSADQGGNIWVAGGSDGLFLLRAGATRFERFTLADGLHPYGYLTGEQAKLRGVSAGTPADPSPTTNTFTSPMRTKEHVVPRHGIRVGAPQSGRRRQCEDHQGTCFDHSAQHD